MARKPRKVPVDIDGNSDTLFRPINLVTSHPHTTYELLLLLFSSLTDPLKQIGQVYQI